MFHDRAFPPEVVNRIEATYPGFLFSNADVSMLHPSTLSITCVVVLDRITRAFNCIAALLSHFFTFAQDLPELTTWITVRLRAW